MKRRTLILLFGGGSSGALTLGSGAFSSASMDRGVDVDVVSDDKAVVGYESSDISVTGDDTVVLIEVHNQFGGDVDISIDDAEATVEGGDGDPDVTAVETTDDAFSPGESGEVRGEVSCQGAGTAVVEVTVTVSGEGVRAELYGDRETRSFEVTCVPPIESVAFAGNGNAVVSPDGLTLRTEALYVDPSDGSTRVEPSGGPFQWATSTNLQNARPKKEYDPSGKLAAVRFIDREATYYNPRHGPATIDFPEGWTDGEENPIAGERNGNGGGDPGAGGADGQTTTETGRGT
ncbi:hypothetical protein [Haloparvum sedimenti]|uniref:hypothetical protein n=1 Tax=Haloparvum sedimenti TaxID=1678448 RepID=UPI00071E6948|nr:hypothetical protein [Haloparvum sedimenti]